MSFCILLTHGDIPVPRRHRNNQTAAISRVGNLDHPNVVLISFILHTHGRVVLDLTVDGEQVPWCPIQLDIVPLTEAFTQLRAHPRTIESTPTLTISRGNILDSAMAAMHAYTYTFHQVVRVHCNDETSIDAGGIAK